MKQFVYILIGIIWIAYSLYRSQKKQREKAIARNPSTPLENKEPQSKPNFESIFEELLGGKKENYTPIAEKANYNPKPSLISEEVRGKNSIESYSLESKSLEENFIAQKKATRYQENSKNEMQVPAENQKIEAFDLQKAFIYQTILHRPYS
jgi:hypothetical protein